MKISRPQVIDAALALLFVTLPFSAWLVSLTGYVGIALVRDLAVAVLLLCAARYIPKKVTSSYTVGLAALLVCYAALSIFWRETSVEQWFRGFRYTMLPIIFFIAVSSLRVSKRTYQVVRMSIYFGLIVILASCLLEIMGFKIPLTNTDSGVGSLSVIHKVGGLGVERLDSILVGPNSLGLYLLAVLGFCLWEIYSGKYRHWMLLLLVVLVLLPTFSRSSLLGAMVLLLSAGFLFVRTRLDWKRALTGVLVVSGMLTGLGWVLLQNPGTRDVVTHYDSTSLRVIEYQRVWNERKEIGLLGRGMGTSGPSSQNRLDGGPNRWTENIYLDMYSELGLIGFILYCGLIFSLLYAAYERRGEPLGKVNFTLGLGFGITGLCINYYIGQVGVFTYWLLAGLLLQLRATTKPATVDIKHG